MVHLRVVALAVLLLGIAVVGCQKPKDRLDIDITVQPQGSIVVDTVFCTFTGASVRADGEEGPLEEPIEVSTLWYSPHGQYNPQTHVWSSHKQTRTITVFRAADYGYLDKPHWCVIRWSDADGDHEIISDTAHCE
jgi:hypothetical protein